MTDHPSIVLDPAILTGKPVIRGTRLSVDFIIGLMADGWTEPDILRNYPGLSSRPGEFHPQALPEPCMTLSSHTAPDVRPSPWHSGQ